MPSRRSYLLGLATAIAGCSANPGSRSTTEPSDTTDAPTTGTTTTPPSASPPPSTPEPVERLPADHPALAWAVRVPEPITYPPAVGDDRERLYVGTGEVTIGTPTEGGGDEPLGGVFGLEATDGSEAWRVRTDAPVVDAPVVHGGQVYAAIGFSNGFYGVDQRVVAYARDGGRRWATDTWGKWLSIVAAHDGSVFVGTNDDALGSDGEHLFALGGDGAVRWERGTGDVFAATVADGSLLHGGAGGRLTAYALSDGSVRWEAPGRAPGFSSTGVAAAGGRCFVEAREETEVGRPVVARSTADGSELWRYPAEGGSGTFASTGVATVSASTRGDADGPVVVGTGHDGSVFALDADGTERWTFDAGAETRGPVVGDAVYLSDADGTVYALSPSDGSERWRRSFPGSAAIWPLSGGLLVYVWDGVVASFDADGSERWRYDAGRDLVAPRIAGDRVYAAATDGTVLAFVG